MDLSKFHVITMISNPYMYNRRYDLYHKFKKHMHELADVNGMPRENFRTVEVAYGARPFEVTTPSDPSNLCLRTDEVLWHKENALLLLVNQLPRDWEYCCWVDADVTFMDPMILQATWHQLQHNHVVQMFENAIDMGPNGQVIQVHKSFCATYIDERMKIVKPVTLYNQNKWHTGFAWSMTRAASNALGGGLIDTAILGAGDHHSAWCLVNQAERSMPKDISAGYKQYVLRYQKRAERAVRRDIGYVKGSLTHAYHGSKKNRRYIERWDIITENNFDPSWDIKRDSQGLYHLEDHGDMRSIKIRDEIRAYFSQRNEDSIDL